MDPESHFGQSKPRAPTVHNYAVVAGEGKFETASEAVAIYFSYGGNGQRFDTMEDGAGKPGQFQYPLR
jgi:hypothetical protein